MRPKKQSHNQLSFLAPSLKEQLNPKHPLYLLAQRIDWGYFERKFAPLYADKGRPAHPIRLMVALLIFKAVYDLSDEQLVLEQWEMNGYFQLFSGMQHQKWGAPCSPSDLVYFTRRIGKKGAEMILKHSIEKHGKQAQEPHVSIDTTVQEKNITYPTDAKQYKKIIDKAVKIARDNNLSLRRSYKPTAKQLLSATHNPTHPKRRIKAQAA